MCSTQDWVARVHLKNFLGIGLEIYLVFYLLAVLIFGIFYQTEKVNRIIYFSSICSLLIGIFILLNSLIPNGTFFNGSFVNDNFSNLVKVIILLITSAVLMLSYNSLISNKIMFFEFPFLIICSTLGMLIMVSSSDLLILFVGLELQALPLYVLASFKRKSLRSSEAGLKFFVLGALSSGLLLYGCSLVYGATGSINFIEISNALISTNEWVLLLGLGFILSGLAFKLSVVPFHMWAPDVYEGSPTSTTLFLASVPKIAALAMTCRLLTTGFESFINGWQQILCILALFSILFGSVAAIAQFNLKRLLAYSSISHMGFAIIGLASGTPEGIASLVSYMIIYLVMTVGIFCVVLTMENFDSNSLNIESLMGLSESKPNLAILITFLLCSMAGLPPFLGFFAKYYVFVAAIDAGLVEVVIFAVIGSVVGSFYYLRLVYFIYFGKSENPAQINMSKMEYFIFLFASLFVIVGTFSFFGIEEVVNSAAQSLFR